MKDAIFTIEVIRHILANGYDSDGDHDRFQRDSTNAIIFQQSWWHSAFAAALPGTGIRHIKPNDICMDLTVDTKTELYKRRYGRDSYRVHEAIMPGTKVTFQALVADHVAESNLRTLLDRIGRFIGLSPYGHKLGFGKFRLLGLEVKPSDADRRKETDNGRTVKDRQ